MTKGIEQVVKMILKDIRVDLGDEFDQNFERQAFFSKAWPRKKSPLREGRPMLIGTRLRRSVRSKIDGNGVTFYSDLLYAAIHNEGGEIKVTRRMKGYFWYKYRVACGSLGRKKDGSLRRDKRNARISTIADFYKSMALKKVGSVIKIPQRQFLGASPEVERIVMGIIEKDLGEFFKSYEFKK